MSARKLPRTSDQNGAVLIHDSDRKRPLSRSPQPYRRRGNSSIISTDLSDKTNSQVSTAEATRPSTRASSDSGTEADDERGNYLRPLPAPPLRGRKGLRGAPPERYTPAVSPLPTPPLAEEVVTSYFTHVFPPPKRPIVADGKSQDVREKYTKRKRAEITRRTLETALLLGIGLITYQQASTAETLSRWGLEIAGFLWAVAVSYLAYPVRLTWMYFKLWKTPVYAARRGFHIPSRFDPGPLLYPVFIPPFVAASLFHQLPDLMLPNMILGLSSLPRRVIPYPGYAGTTDSIHWAISLSPLVAAKVAAIYGASIPAALKYASQVSVSPEALAILHPLQVTLVPILSFMVSTSLDPAELQLLSVALIDLFLFAVSPQAQILKALLLVGGLALFVFCRRVLAWEVSLARIPSWKFRRTSPKHQSMWRTWDTNLCQLLASLMTTSRKLETSSAESESDGGPPPKPQHRLERVFTSHVQKDSRTFKNGHPRSAVETTGTAWSTITDLKPFRRSTFSGDGHLPSKKMTSNGRLKRSMTPTSLAYTDLTLSQAWIRKWAYAIYTYITVLCIVLVPIRLYVSRQALSRHEPFGWALGYLLGNIPAFRFRVVYHSLEGWIGLPIIGDLLKTNAQLVGVEYIRQIRLGPANTRLAICAYCVTVLLTGIVAILRLTSIVEVDTRRKVFHGIMVAMLLPTIFVDPCFIALALALILAIFLLLDLFRASQLPPISRPITNFLAPYVDGRDHRGPIIVSHIFLLIGCAIPLWLSLAGLPRSGRDSWAGWEVDGRDLSMVSGVICVGMGDAAASLIGRRYGKTKWFWGGGKSLEGSLAFTVAVTIGLITSHLWLIAGGWLDPAGTAWYLVIGKAIVAAAGASMTETLCTSANDNVIVPVALWLLVRGLDI